MKRDIARELFRSYRSKVERRSSSENSERVAQGEPTKISNIFNELLNQESWRSGIAEGNLFTKWPDLVGAEVAQHCERITLLEGKLTIRAESTAWATQLRLLTPELLARIRTDNTGALVDELHILGPQSPSWKRGLRTIKGAKGARDTYG